MSPDPNDPSSKVDLERRRVPLERKISLKFKEFRGFITEYSQNVSMGGMFIRTTSPKPVGTIFDFELSLTDDFKLVQGIGEVIWVRERDDGPERSSGMGVRFLDLSSESRRLIQRIVEEQVAHGGTPFELEPPGFPPPPLRPAVAPAASRPGAQATLFHPTAAPVAPAPPLPSRPAAPAMSRTAPRPVSEAPPPPAPPPPLAPPPPSAPAAPTAPPHSAPVEIDSFPDLGAPELPVPDLAAVHGDRLSGLGDSLEGETLEGIDLVDVGELPLAPLAPSPQGDVLPDVGDDHDDPTLLHPSAGHTDEEAASGHTAPSSPWAARTPPQPAAGAFA
ncbi:MAG TPA: TIGR02266 family protein, partial [Thermoanaerobaculia bacterium]|nr:TIGR02266 family protein [Thermoanaerobaculia bacterium]